MPDRPRPTHLRVEHTEAALGIDAARPGFSWWLPDGADRQIAYRIRVEDGWDTGRVKSADSVLVQWAVRPDRVGVENRRRDA